MIHKLLRIIQSYNHHFTPKDAEQLKALSQQQKNAEMFDQLWQNYFAEQQSMRAIHQATCTLIEIGLALDEWYNGLDPHINLQAYVCLKHLPNTWHILQNMPMGEQLSEENYTRHYQELLKFTRACLHFYIFKENLENDYTLEQYAALLEGF